MGSTFSIFKLISLLLQSGKGIPILLIVLPIFKVLSGPLAIAGLALFKSQNEELPDNVIKFICGFVGIYTFFQWLSGSLHFESHMNSIIFYAILSIVFFYIGVLFYSLILRVLRRKIEVNHPILVPENKKRIRKFILLFFISLILVTPYILLYINYDLIYKNYSSIYKDDGELAPSAGAPIEPKATLTDRIQASLLEKRLYVIPLQVNVRESPDLSSRSRGELSQGMGVRVLEMKNFGSDQAWAKVELSDKATGFIRADLLGDQEFMRSSGIFNHDVRSIIPLKVDIHESPDLSSRRLGQLPKGMRIHVLGIQYNKSGQAWAKILISVKVAGFIRVDFLQKEAQ